MFDLKLTWEDAPGVRDALLAQTWCRLELHVNGHPVIQLLTPGGNVRPYLYGSAFPLASWLVHSLWSLTSEAPPRAGVSRGARLVMQRDAGAHPLKAWLSRHSLLMARDGMRLPDVLIWRDGANVRVVWRPDLDDSNDPKRLIGWGDETITINAFEGGVASFVSSVLERSELVQAPERDELAQDWSALQSSLTEERELCELLAAFGEDPYAPSLADEEIARIYDGLILLPTALRRDLVDVSSPEKILEDLQVVHRLTSGLAREGAPIIARNRFASVRSVSDRHGPPWERGYARARYLRNLVGYDARKSCVELGELISDCVGSVSMSSVRIEADRFISRRRGRVDAALGLVGGQDGAQLVSVDLPLNHSRFLMARALHRWLLGVQSSVESSRLLTAGVDSLSQEGRCFAAELLAPAEGIYSLHREGATDQEIAEHYNVALQVITDQRHNQLD